MSTVICDTTPTYVSQGAVAGTTLVPAGSTVIAPHQKSAGSWLGGLLLSIILIIAFLLIQALIVMLLWNWVIPQIWTGAPKINFMTAIGLVLLIDVLSGIWFKSPFMKF